jgi:hypothetical protein
VTLPELEHIVSTFPLVEAFERQNTLQAFRALTV